jgi:hypothetical protein
MIGVSHLGCQPRALIGTYTKAEIADHGHLLMLNCKVEPDCCR